MTCSLLQSMTAYGYGDHTSPQDSGRGPTTYTCEIRTLNSRYLEVSVRLPRPLLALELDVINHAKASLRRGKVDIFIDMATEGSDRDLALLDPEAIAHYVRITEELRGQLPSDLTPPPPTVAEWLSFEGILGNGRRARSRGKDAAEAHRKPVFEAVNSALLAVKDARRKEGEATAKAMLELLTTLEAGREAVVQKRAIILPNLHKAYVKRLENLVMTLQKNGQAVGSGLPEDRLLAEAATLVDKADIEEELTRLIAHLDEFRRVMREEEGAGRKLDFICQEMHREVNTMSNKLLQTDVAQHTLEMKQTVERIRQQVQNIE